VVTFIRGVTEQGCKAQNAGVDGACPSWPTDSCACGLRPASIRDGRPAMGDGDLRSPLMDD